MSSSRPAPEFAHNRENISMAYRSYEHLMVHWKNDLPETALYELDYERLVEEPEGEKKKLLEFLGLSSDTWNVPASDGGALNTPSFWQARQAIYKTSVGKHARYRNHFAP